MILVVLPPISIPIIIDTIIPQLNFLVPFINSNNHSCDYSRYAASAIALLVNTEIMMTLKGAPTASTTSFAYTK